MLNPYPSSPGQSLDTVIIRDIRLEATVGPDRWGKVRNQPILVSVLAHTPLGKAGLSDDVTDSIHYGDLGKEILAQVGVTPFPSLYALAEGVAMITIGKGAESAEVQAEALNQFLSARCLSVALERGMKADTAVQPKRDRVSIRDLLLHIIIGVNPPERIHKQEILVNIDFWPTAPEVPNIDWSKNYQILVEVIESTSFQTLEAFSTKVAGSALEFGVADTVTITAQKPKALSYADSSGVQITRSKADALHE